MIKFECSKEKFSVLRVKDLIIMVSPDRCSIIVSDIRFQNFYNLSMDYSYKILSLTNAELKYNNFGRLQLFITMNIGTVIKTIKWIVPAFFNTRYSDSNNYKFKQIQNYCCKIPKNINDMIFSKFQIFIITFSIFILKNTDYQLIKDVIFLILKWIIEIIKIDYLNYKIINKHISIAQFTGV